MGWVNMTNEAVARSFVGRYFQLENSGHHSEHKGTRFLTEVNAGLATFFAMAYIISVNSQIVSQTGGTCICTSTIDPTCTKDSEYLKCVQGINQDLVTATAAIAALSSVAMGIFANMPISLAPGMGLNTWLAYQVIGFHGTGSLSFQSAMTAVFVEGLIFFLVTLLGLRQWLTQIIPTSLKVAAGAGIGLYITLVGLTYSAGIGAITGGSVDPLQLAGCVPSLIDPVTGRCTSDLMRNPTLWLGIACGGIFTALLLMYKVRGAIIFGILLASIISWPRNTTFTAFPDTPQGDFAFEFFKQVVTFHPIKHIFAVQNWHIQPEESGDFALTLFTLLYINILDLAGTLYSMSLFCGAISEKTQDFESSTSAYVVNALSISIGSFFGCPPTTAFIESGAGIADGGTTGLTACVTGLCFFISIFFAPIFASIPPWATGCTLILIGSMMTRAVVKINWNYMGDSIPAFLTLAIMPFTYSIAYGLIAGIVAYVALNGVVYMFTYLSAGKIKPHDYDLADEWSARPESIIPPWMIRVFHGKKDFWRAEQLNDKNMPQYSREMHVQVDRMPTVLGSGAAVGNVPSSNGSFMGRDMENLRVAISEVSLSTKYTADSQTNLQKVGQDGPPTGSTVV